MFFLPILFAQYLRRERGENHKMRLPGLTNSSAFARDSRVPNGNLPLRQGGFRSLPAMGRTTMGPPQSALNNSSLMASLMKLLQNFMKLFKMMSHPVSTTPVPQPTTPGDTPPVESGTDPGTGVDPGGEVNPGTGEDTGVVPPAAGGIGAEKGTAANKTIKELRDMNYSDMKQAEERVAFNGLSRDSAAIIHLGGRAHISEKETENGVSGSARIYNNVLAPGTKFSPEEQALAKKWQASEISQHGFATGENLDKAFIQELGIRDGISAQKLQQYTDAVDARVAKLDKAAASSPELKAKIIQDSQTPINMIDDVDKLEGQSGLTADEQAAYRLAGHSVLFSGTGQVNGDILPITLGNAKALDGRKAAANIDPQVRKLMNADFADDGKLNGTSLRAANEVVMDKVFLGGAGLTGKDDITRRGNAVAKANGRTPQQIRQSIMQGGKQALTDFKNMAKDHSPAMLAGAATMAGAAAICPFLGGMAAGALGIGAGQKLGKEQPTN